MSNLPPDDDPPDHMDDGLDNVIDMQDAKSKSTTKKKAARKRPAASVPSGPGWEAALLYRDPRDGPAIEVNIHNVSTVLLNADEFVGCLAFDEFAGRPTILKPCPAQPSGTFPCAWQDLHDRRAAKWLQASRWRMNCSHDLVSVSILVVAHEHVVHPLRERLNAVAWDGVQRTDKWLTTYLGAEDTPYHREVGRKWLISLIARAFSPGCKVDHVLVLEGKQRALKSTALRILSLGYFADDIPDLGTKDSAIHLQGLWLIEMAELESLDKATINRIKAFVTRTTDRYRAVWDKYAADHPRQCGFAGSTNESDYLKDPTGGRRWWPVPMGIADIAALERDVEQLWAEALVDFRDGKPWWFTDEKSHSAAADIQADRYVADAWDDKIVAYLGKDKTTTISDILTDVFEIRLKDQDRGVQMRVANCLKFLKWSRRRRTTDASGHRLWEYVAPEPTPEVGTEQPAGQASEVGTDPP
jgi:predicted P-loop ATPase